LIKYYPLKLKPRKQQIDAMKFCDWSIKNNNKNILLNMPTGSGKSFFVIMFANWYKNVINKNAKFDVITNSKILQNQYINDFPFIMSLKGMSNYYCDFHNSNCSIGKDMNQILKRKCEKCPYDISKYKWLNADIGITNFALFISMLIYTENLDKKKSNVLIIDEAHDFENVFCDFISIKLSKNVIKKLGFNNSYQELYNNIFNNITKPIDFISILRTKLIPDINELIDNKIKKLDNDNNKTIIKNQISNCNKSIEKYNNLIDIYNENTDNWSIDITYDKNNNIILNLQPIWGNIYLKKLWEKYDHIIFMSGTLLNRDMFSYINGLDTNKTSYKEMDSVFNIKNRPLYYIKVGKMTYNEKEKTFKKQLLIINKILKKYESQKGIIHTFNYEISNWLKNNINNKRLLFHDNENRDEIFDKFIKSKRPLVMVSPSMISGVDLKDDLSRFAIIMKVPYPNISSNKIKNRQKANKEWYNFNTVSSLIQMYGRTVRSTTDYSNTFILDESFSNILKYNSKYLPKYFTKAIKIIK